MKIIDLDAEHEALYFLCLEDWSDEAKEAGPRRGQWYAKMKERGLRAKLALDDRGEVGAMIQYLPIEHSAAIGKDLYLVLCVWVHGHKQGRGDFRGQGMGSALLAAAEEDVQGRGAKGLAAWGLWLPFWMRASWFRKHGYAKADRMGVQSLVWKKFADDVSAPRWMRAKKTPAREPGRVTVTALVNGWCMAMNLAYERLKRAAGEFGDRVVFREFDTTEPAVRDEWGMTDALFVDSREVRTGPPPTYAKVRRIIEKRVRAL
jgi:GNAT superfamily N-acetyltransferase